MNVFSNNYLPKNGVSGHHCSVMKFGSIYIMHILFQIGFSVLFLHNRQGTSEFPVHAFQDGQYGLSRANMDSRGPIQIQEGQYGFTRANTDSGGLIRIQEGQYGFRRANTELSMQFRKTNTEPSMHFRRASTETIEMKCKSEYKSQEGHGFPWAGRAGPSNFPRALPSGNPSEQPCQPLKTPSFQRWKRQHFLLKQGLSQNYFT